MTSIISGFENKLQTNSHVHRFFKRFHVVDCLKAADIKKVKGYPLLSLVQFLFMLVFTQRNLYRHMEENNRQFGKDLVYRFLNNPNSNWRLFMLKLSSNIINSYMNPLTGSDRPKVLIVDDSLFSRNRSKKVELLAKVFDHTQHRYVKGFRKLTVGWSDGASFIPLAFSLLSSPDPKNRLYEQGPDIPDKCPGSLRREEALLPATTALLGLIDEALKHTQAFNYVLFDSWFSWPNVITDIKSRKIDVICMLKDMPRIYYGYNGTKCRLSKLYDIVPKTESKSDCIASALVDYNGIPARVVFVRNRNKKRDWLALLSTDVTISEEEIIRIYGIRWDIEVYFKMCKSFLGLAKEFQFRNYDGMIAHTTLVSIRYMLLSIENRDNKDDRTSGGIFYDLCSEAHSISFAQALGLIFNLLIDLLRKKLFLTEQVIIDFLEGFMERIPSYLKNCLPLVAA